MLKILLKKINDNKLAKIASANFLSISVRLFSGFLVSKSMAIFIGPAGMAISGNLSNFMQSLEGISSLGIKSGIIKYVAECKEDKIKFKEVISSAFIITLSIAIVLSFFLFLFSNSLSQFIFNSVEYAFLFEVLSLMIPFYLVHIFFISVINGLKKIKDLLQTNIVSYIITAVLIIALMYKRQLDGALIAIVLTPLLLFSSLFYRFKLLKQIILDMSFISISKKYFKKILSFFSMTLFSGIMIPLIILLIRNYIIENIGVNEAGYWEAMRKISNYYMIFFYALFELYLLPSLSENDNNKFKSIVFGFYKMLLPFVSICFVIIYLLKFIIIKLVLTNVFFDVHELFAWQLFGDFFRIISLAISYQFLAKKMIRLYLICEIIYMIFIYFSSIYLIDSFGIIGAVKAYAFSYIFYTLLMFFVFKNELFRKEIVA